MVLVVAQAKAFKIIETEWTTFAPTGYSCISGDLYDHIGRLCDKTPARELVARAFYG